MPTALETTKMRTFKMTVAYDGTHFCGWQVQHKGERTVQGLLEKAARHIFKHPVTIIGSGRTDSGVHALAQVVSFSADTRMMPAQIQKAFNANLDLDVSVSKVEAVGSDFHAQYSVVDKTYRYRILNAESRYAFERNHAYFFPYDLNLAAMRTAAKHLTGRHDFKSFQAHDPLRADKSSVRTIKKIVIKKADDVISIDVCADGFLYKMVRNITGALMAVGSGRMRPDEILKILKSKNRSKAPETAPAHGLFLVKVRY